jgi:uncharacterized protein (DUF488 family)
MASLLYTIGHSTHPIEVFIKILQEHEIELLADVRTIPRSRHNAQFDQVALERELIAHGIEYLHLKELGGLRRTSKNSINTGWKNASFRGFADYMQTQEFQTGLERLSVLASEKRIVLMCAEALPWRCHRSLIADALLVRGYSVEDLIGEGNTKPHRMTPWARVDGTTITYPAIIPSGPETELVDDLLKSHSSG